MLRLQKITKITISSIVVHGPVNAVFNLSSLSTAERYPIRVAIYYANFKCVLQSEEFCLFLIYSTSAGSSKLETEEAEEPSSSKEAKKCSSSLLSLLEESEEDKEMHS